MSRRYSAGGQPQRFIEVKIGFAAGVAFVASLVAAKLWPAVEVCLL